MYRSGEFSAIGNRIQNISRIKKSKKKYTFIHPPCSAVCSVDDEEPGK